MFRPTMVHQSLNIENAINGVIRAHHALLATVTFLKDKVQALEEQNSGLTARVAVLEQSSRCCLQEWVGRRRVMDGMAASGIWVDVQEELAEETLYEQEDLAWQRRLMPSKGKRILAQLLKGNSQETRAEIRKEELINMTSLMSQIAEEKRISNQKKNAKRKLANSKRVEMKQMKQARAEEIEKNKQIAVSKIDEQRVARTHCINERVMNKMGKDSRYPMHQASIDGVILITERNDFNATDDLGNTPLHYAAHKGHIDIVDYLVNNGADVNAKDGGGWTPLHWAAYRGHMHTVTYLLKRNADVNAKNAYGWTPRCLADGNGRGHVVALLSSYGGS